MSMKVLTDEGLAKLWDKALQTIEDHVTDEMQRAKSVEGDIKSELDTHESNFSNPHKVTKAQVGLDKVDNTADADKVVASADKLTTSRKIWGQEFGGTADVSGDITLDGNIIVPGGAQLIDLGLPSGTLWMDRNVGASSPEDAGLYFAWGETTGYTADEVGKTKQFSWDDYKFGTSGSITKYNSTDGLTTLETTDDAVLQNVHKYSMPTKEQLQELDDETTSTWTTQNGVNGRLFTSKTNGNSIFIPAAGHSHDGLMYGVDSYCYLWSSSLDGDNTNYALYSCSVSYNANFWRGDDRCYGKSVRGVATPAEVSTETITLPSSSGTLALTSDVEAETARATAKEEELQAAIDSKQDSGKYAVLDSYKANNEHWLYFSSASSDPQITCKSEDGKYTTQIRGGNVIVSDGSCGVGITPNGVRIPELSEKDLLSARETTYYVGSESDTTEYTAVAPLGSDNKIPAQYLDSSSSSPAYPYLFFSYGTGGEEYIGQEITVKEGEIISITALDLVNKSPAKFYVRTSDQDFYKRTQFEAYDGNRVYLTGGSYTAVVCSDWNNTVIYKVEQCSEIPSGTDSSMIFNPTASTTA